MKLLPTKTKLPGKFGLFKQESIKWESLKKRTLKIRRLRKARLAVNIAGVGIGSFLCYHLLEGPAELSRQEINRFWIDSAVMTGAWKFLGMVTNTVSHLERSNLARDVEIEAWQNPSFHSYLANASKNGEKAGYVTKRGDIGVLENSRSQEPQIARFEIDAVLRHADWRKRVASIFKPIKNAIEKAKVNRQKQREDIEALFVQRALNDFKFKVALEGLVGVHKQSGAFVNNHGDILVAEKYLDISETGPIYSRQKKMLDDLFTSTDGNFRKILGPNTIIWRAVDLVKVLSKIDELAYKKIPYP